MDYNEDTHIQLHKRCTKAKRRRVGGREGEMQAGEENVVSKRVQLKMYFAFDIQGCWRQKQRPHCPRNPRSLSLLICLKPGLTNSKTSSEHANRLNGYLFQNNLGHLKWTPPLLPDQAFPALASHGCIGGVIIGPVKVQQGCDSIGSVVCHLPVYIICPCIKYSLTRGPRW